VRNLFDVAKTVVWVIVLATLMLLFFATIAPPGTMRLPWH